MKILDGVFCAFLALCTAGHLIGTITRTEYGSGLFVWSLSGVLASALLVAFNTLRIRRPGDKAIAIVSLAGNIAWLGIVVLFGQSIKNLFDPRVLMHAGAALVLGFFSARDLLKA